MRHHAQSVLLAPSLARIKVRNLPGKSFSRTIGAACSPIRVLVLKASSWRALLPQPMNRAKEGGRHDADAAEFERALERSL